MEAKQIEYLLQHFAAISLITDEELQHYGHDETEDFNFPPQLVLRPTTTAQVSGILAYCNQENIPVTPSGARTGLSGGALPIHGGVVVSMEKMNKIL